MAYARRGRGGPYVPPTFSSANVGQRRQQPPVSNKPISNNFVPGGQLMQFNKPVAPGNHPQCNLHQQHNQQDQHVQQQQQFQKNPPGVTPSKVEQTMEQAAQQMINQQSKLTFKAEDSVVVSTPAAPIISEENNVMEEDADATLKKNNRQFWLRRDGKISKKERLRRRNQRLRKILQPKNALMVLNELVGTMDYNLTESGDPHDNVLFRCSVNVNGTEHFGCGRSKPAAKTAAAEAALKHFVLSRIKNSNPLTCDNLTDVDADVPMITDEVPEDPAVGPSISWSHVASFALHKLLNSWDDEGGNLAEKLVALSSSPSSGELTPNNTTLSNQPIEKKPAKKLPANAETMNPIMLLNQMQPSATYEEVEKVGAPPNIQFTMKCTINNMSFVGAGSSKKAARKQCALQACQKILGIKYPSEMLLETALHSV